MAGFVRTVLSRIMSRSPPYHNPAASATRLPENINAALTWNASTVEVWTNPPSGVDIRPVAASMSLRIKKDWLRYKQITPICSCL